MSKNHSKSEYRRKEREKERMNRPYTEQEAQSMILYITYSVLYMNDTACNVCREIEPKLKEMPFKGNGAKKIYGALMKKVDYYYTHSTKVFGQEIDFIAEQFGNLDDIFDDLVIGVKKAVEQCYTEQGLEHADFYAKVEQARLISEYAVMANKFFTETFGKIIPFLKNLKGWCIEDIKSTATSMSDFCFEIIKNRLYVNMQEYKPIKKAINKLNNTFLNTSKFIEAYNNAVMEVSPEHYETEKAYEIS